MKILCSAYQYFLGLALVDFHPSGDNEQALPVFGIGKSRTQLAKHQFGTMAGMVDRHNRPR
jgi:hypothetical protein